MKAKAPRWIVATCLFTILWAFVACSRSAFADAAKNKECEDNFAYGNQLLNNTPPVYTGAIDAYNAVLKECPDFNKGDLLAQNLAYAYLHLVPPEVDNAIQALSTAVQNYPNSVHIVDLQTALGTAYIAAGDGLFRDHPDQARPYYLNAINTLDKVKDLQTDPGMKAQVAFDIGNAQFEIGNYTDASQTYKDLIATTPPASLFAPTLYNLGNAQLHLASAATTDTDRNQSYDQAAQSFTDLAVRFPNDPNAQDAQLQVARIRYQQKKYQEAIPLFKMLVSSKSATVAAEALNFLAFSYVGSKDFDAALPLLKQYVDSNPGTSEADNASIEIGYILRTIHNDLPSSLIAYKTAATSRDPKMVKLAQDGEIAVAAAYMKARNYPQALDIYDGLIGALDDKINQDAFYGRALTLFSMKDPRSDQAMADYLKNFPTAAPAAGIAYRLGANQYDEKNYTGALASFSMAATANSDDSSNPDQRSEREEVKRQSLYWAGKSAEQSQQGDMALKFWQQELAADTGFTSLVTSDVLVAMARYYNTTGMPDKARQYEQEALQHFGDRPGVLDALMDFGVQASRHNNYDQAILIYKQLIEAQPHSSTGGAALFNLGVIYLKTNPPAPDLAAKQFQAYLDTFPTGSLADRARLNLAQAYETQAMYNQADYKTDMQNALAVYRKATEVVKDPKLASHAAWKTGVIEGKLGLVDKALQDLDAAINRYPESPDLDNMVFEKAHVYQVAHRYPEAIAGFLGYLARFKTGLNVPAAHFNLAVMEYNTAETLSDRNAAKADYLKAADDFDLAQQGQSAAVPLDLAAYYSGWAAANSGQTDRAIKAFRKFLASYPDDERAPAASARIGILIATTNPDEAIKLLKPYLAGNPSKPDLMDANLAMGQAYLQENQPKSALPALRKAVELADALNASEQGAAGCVALGRCYAKLGDKVQAKVSFSKVLDHYKDQTDWVKQATDELHKLQG